uniref:Uncharacterized protein n=1 Tax=Nelumbo nucifera TaxID=4432 RepID=A0A822YJX3_NELNU|nr:TPA_asm: hypothetical protein HUJ06_005134 [Nelumbo nucifera]
MDEVLGKPTMISRVLLRLLFLSFTLNVGLVSRLIYEYDHERGSSSLHTTDAEEKQSYTEFCLGEEASKKTRESTTMSTAAADHEAYVSESSPSLSTEAEEDGKEKVVNLDQ